MNNKNPLFVLWDKKGLPNKEGVIKLNSIPENDGTIYFCDKDGMGIGAGIKNGSQLTYNGYSDWRFFTRLSTKLFGIYPPRNKLLRFLFWKFGYHSLPYHIYYYGFKQFKQ